MTINNLCACCLRDLQNYPDNRVYCDQCKQLRDVVSKVDAFSLVRAIQTTREDVNVVETRGKG